MNAIEGNYSSILMHPLPPSLLTATQKQKGQNHKLNVNDVAYGSLAEI